MDIEGIKSAERKYILRVWVNASLINKKTQLIDAISVLQIEVLNF